MPNRQVNFLERPLSYKTLFWYPGSKVLAVPTISKIIPVQMKEMVSPFLGGGSLELWLSARGTKVYAYDKNSSLINLWYHIVSDGFNLSEWTKQKLNSVSRDELIQEIKQEENNEDSFIRAGYYYLRQSLSWNGMVHNKTIGRYEIVDGFAFYQKKNGNRGEKLTRFTRLKEFYNPNLIISKACSFEESLEDHEDLFAYLDPPYDCVGSHYGEDFDHKKLADILNQRKSPFLLSYYDTDLVQELYPQNKFHRINKSWYQVNRKNQIVTKEVLICNNEFLDITDKGIFKK